jgi:anaerobic ribonucleoside-triphosphate reductase activating protein
MLRYAGIISNDTVDVDKGIAVSFWTQGCPHHCEGCHNQDTWNFKDGYELPKDYIEQIKELLHKNRVHRSLSILGGEPLCKENADIVYNLVSNVKESYPNTKILLWTGGIFESLYKKYKYIFKYIDILIDGPFILKKRDVTLPLRGSDNQRIIDIKKSLKEKKTVVIPDSEFFK